MIMAHTLMWFKMFVGEVMFPLTFVFKQYLHLTLKFFSFGLSLFKFLSSQHVCTIKLFIFTDDGRLKIKFQSQQHIQIGTGNIMVQQVRLAPPQSNTMQLNCPHVENLVQHKFV